MRTLTLRNRHFYGFFKGQASSHDRSHPAKDQRDACLSNLLDLPVTFLSLLAMLAACSTANETTLRWSDPSALSISGSSLVPTAH